MNKFYLIPVIISILVAVAISFIYININNNSSVDVLKKYNLTPLECDLMKETCVKEYNGQKIYFDILPKPVEIMAESTIKITGLDYDFYDAKIRIFGLNMDMGTIIASLNKEGDAYIAKVALSACLVENIMRYRIAVYDGNDPIDLYIDFDIPR